ncbi:MAG: indolepyruvate oxidoreductase subunit beta [Clostridia bacterium]|nr:indolepyruvate oxidoreductase subunit beta [Clostridia bacterium]
MNKNCLICGVGGQGVVLASRLIAFAAMDTGLFARTAETIGMAQRGGSVASHVRIGAHVYSPLIPKGEADLILALEPGEAVRALPYLKPDGLIVVSSKAMRPVSAAVAGGYTGQKMLDYLKRRIADLIIVDTEAICRQAGSQQTANIALLGAAAASKRLGLSLEQIEQALRDHTRQQFFATNHKALRLGADTILKGEHGYEDA